MHPNMPVGGSVRSIGGLFVLGRWLVLEVAMQPRAWDTDEFDLVVAVDGLGQRVMKRLSSQ